VRSGFDYDLVENLQSYVVKLTKFVKYAQTLKELRCFQGDSNREIVPDERPGCCRGGS
jgi:hypothetical protein